MSRPRRAVGGIAAGGTSAELPHHLPDIPCVYLSDRNGWHEYKRALTDCGLTWNIPDWMTTIVYKGKEWNEIGTKGTDLSRYFPVANLPPGMVAPPVVAAARVEEEERGERKLEGERKVDEPAAPAALRAEAVPDLVKLLGFATTVQNEQSSSTLFCNLSKVEFESDRRLPARQKFWNWMVRSLRGVRTIPGPYHYLVDEVQMYDISYLFKRLCQVLDQITICSLDDELEAVIKMDFKPQSQNIFSYYADLRKAIKRLTDVNELLPVKSRLILPDAYIRSRLVRAARQVPVFKPIIDSLLIMPITQWSAITSDDMYHRLEAVCANDISIEASRVIIPPMTDDAVSANIVAVAKKKDIGKKKRTCFEFVKKGSCSKGEACSFSHSAPEKKENAQQQKQNRPPKTCDKCGDNHSRDSCQWKGKCNWCRRDGHKEAVCNSKKAGKAQVLLAAEDGAPVRAFMLKVEDAHTLAVSAPDGKVSERFYADTGANRSMHPSMRSAANFYRVALNIGTAAGGKAMQSEGVGKMLLYTSTGAPMPGFDSVIFTKQAAEKLASVGDLCDAGLVCVFDACGMRTYKQEHVKIEGKFFTCDERDKKNRLYPLTLFRNAGERDISKNIAALSVINSLSVDAIPAIVSTPLAVCDWGNLPDVVLDDVKLPAALLSRTYMKPDLSQIERMHAKFGHVGIKQIKRILPSLVIPKKFRCEFCIDGKIHKFGHGACAPGSRTEYAPGVCIHTDHSGPYAMSVGGARYSQLFLDRGSGYLWGARMAKKIGHYTETPKIFLDAYALSGRRVQIFHSDGDGVFSSKETKDLLAKEKIRHEYSAPYDSNTNAFVERARRTIFEGVCTALLRAGAPAGFWGEAENHKIFTMNVLPTVADPTKKGVFISRLNLLQGNRRPFNLDHLLAFGTALTCYIPKERRRGGKEPAQRRSFKGVLLGYAETMPAYRVWDLDRKIIKSVSYNFVICHEGYYPFRDKSLWDSEMLAEPTCFSPVVGGVLTTFEWKKFHFDEEDAGEVLGVAPDLIVDRPDPEILPPPAIPRVSADTPLPSPPPPVVEVLDRKHEDVILRPSVGLKKFWQEALDAAKGPSNNTPLSPSLPPAPVLRRSERLAQLQFSSVEPEVAPNFSQPYDKPVGIAPPKTYREASLSPWWPQYKEAAQKEVDGHVLSRTWELVLKKDVPHGKNVIRGKWVFDDKRGEDGKIVKFKARFVAVGSSQKHGVDYDETFAGVMVAKSFRIMLVILNEDPSFEMEHWDVRMAFTQAYLDEEIFMFQPQGFEIDGENKVCKLIKSLYGLKQSARNWQILLTEIFKEVGFFSLMADPCIYFLKKENGWCMCSTHVDDIFSLFNPSGKILRDSLFEKILSYMEVENLGPVSWALKTHILRDRVAGIIKISQEQFTRELVEKNARSVSPNVFPLKSSNFHPHFTPSYGKISEETEFTRVDENLKKGFQTSIGAFWWLAQISRPDIFFAVHRCAKMVNQPTKNLGIAIDQIFKYLAETFSQGIVFQRHKAPLTLSGFVDASFASEPNAVSRLGYFFLFQGNLVSWCSENPKRVMTSSTEVECRGLVQISKENLWHRQFHDELNLFTISGPTIVYEDNSASITMSKNPGIPHKRSKHFGIEWAFFKQAVDMGEIKPIHVSTNEQPADMLTKPLPLPKFIYFRDMVMGAQHLQRHFEKEIIATHSVIECRVHGKAQDNPLALLDAPRA